MKDETSTRFVSAQQVAKLAGVSRSAVSRTFTPGASVAPATREKVLRAAEELGYHVNDLARGVLANQSKLVGIVATKPELGFRAHLTAALAAALIRQGNVPVLVNTGQTEEEMLAAQKILIGHRAQATIIISGSPPASFFELARRNGQPLVVIGRTEPGADHVFAGNTEASSEIVRQMVAVGRSRLAFVGAHSRTPSIVERETAFTAAARTFGLTVRIANGAESDYDGGLAAAELLAQQGEAPDAIFCANDQLAFGLMDALRNRHGLRVPEDIVVVGFDDVPEAAWLSYRLTTFRQDPAVMAKRAVDLLAQRLVNPAAPTANERVVPELIIRDSFRPA